MTHPLSENENWSYSQPAIRIAANYETRGLGSRPRSALTSLTSSNTCRETLIYNIRQCLRQKLYQEKKDGFQITHSQTHDVRLRTPAACKPGQNMISLVKENPNLWNDDQDQQFIQVVDYILGPICVLLDPDRPQGTWWKEGSGSTGGALVWVGTTNWFLAHPVTVALFVGLYRQCYQLIIAGEADNILAAVDSEEVEEVLTECSQKKALAVIKKTRPWIEVPVATPGSRGNYPFPLKTWRRLIRLQRAIRHHSYEEVFGHNFVDGWQLASGGDFGVIDGSFGYWGDEDNLTEAHRHLMKLGAPRRKVSARK